MLNLFPAADTPLTLAAIVARLNRPPPVEAEPAPEPPPALPLPTTRQPGARWHRHEFPGGAYELRANGQRLVAVTPNADGFLVKNIGAGTARTHPTATAADEAAARIARILTV